MPPAEYLDNNLSISERNLIKNSFCESLSNLPSDVAMDVSNAEVSITTRLTIVFVSFFTFSSTFASTASFLALGVLIVVSLATSALASFSAFSSTASTCFSIFSATSLAVDSITASAVFSFVPSIMSPLLPSFSTRFLLSALACSALRFPSCAFVLNARYCSIILSHSASVLPVFALISAFAFSTSVAVCFVLGVAGFAGFFVVAVEAGLRPLVAFGFSPSISFTSVENLSTTALNFARTSALNDWSCAFFRYFANCSSVGLFSIFYFLI